MANILIIDDNDMFCNILTEKLENMGHEVKCVFTLEDGCLEAVNGFFDVVYLDVRLPDGNGLDKLQAICNVASAPEVIIITGIGDPDGAELAIKEGAWDYIEKPSSLNNMVLPMIRALQYREMKKVRKPAVALRRKGLIGNSPRIQICLDQIAQAASSDAGVLISGETGTGKELAAWAVHNNSTRANGNFVVVDCAALSETLVEGILFGHKKGAYTGADTSHDGLIKQADGGTLFLDEVGELPFTIQRSFLRVLQERRYRPLGSKEEVSSDFRLVAATNRDLDKMVENGLFRHDLLYRLRSFLVELPPLRERLDDIADLAVHHTRKICDRYGIELKGFSPEFLEALKSYSWPGNVRELVNTLEQCIAAARQEPVLIPKHLPINTRAQVARSIVKKKKPEAPSDPNKTGFSLPTWQDFREEALPRLERRYLENLISTSGNSVKKACAISGLSRSRLYELIKKHNLSTLSDQPPRLSGN